MALIYFHGILFEIFWINTKEYLMPVYYISLTM
uniref:Uncharacterized protein n=1 Tax=Anguilla anguilla TaxID=7936 RepID=A0A0E9XTY3_ANGAN